MKLLGVHLDIGENLENIQALMDNHGCETCSLFFRDKDLKALPLHKETIEKFKKIVKNPQLIIPHAPYSINFGNPMLKNMYLDCLVDDMRRCFDLGFGFYNIHPGSDSKGVGEEALSAVADKINFLHKKVEKVVICIENMPGGTRVLGKSFVDLKKIIDMVEDKTRIGVTLDTAHLFSSGFDITTKEGFEKIMANFDKIVSLKYLKAMHLNDSKYEFNSGIDKHLHIGEGKIGLDAFKYIMNSPIFDNIPMILETPNPEKFKSDIELLRSFILK